MKQKRQLSPCNLGGEEYRGSHPLPFSVITFKALPGVKDPEKTIETFLQGQLTCDIREISANTWRPFAHCNLQGRMVSLGKIFFAGEYGLIVPRDLLDITRNHLNTYAKFSRIQVENRPEIQCFGLWAHPDFPLSHTAQSLEKSLKPYESLPLNDGSVLLGIESNPFRGLAVINNSSLKFMPEEDHGNLAEISAWQKADILAKQAFLSPQTSGKFLPHDINLPENRGVSFQKGCFLGQEIIARMEHLGSRKRRLAITDIPNEDSISSVIHDGKYYGLILEKNPNP